MTRIKSHHHPKLMLTVVPIVTHHADLELIALLNLVTFESTVKQIIRRRQREVRYYTVQKNKCPVSHKICDHYVCRHLFYPNLAHYLNHLNIFEFYLRILIEAIFLATLEKRVWDVE